MDPANEKTLAARELAKSLLLAAADSEAIPEETLSLAETLFDESDRGVVLVSAALLDDSLDSLIRTVMSNKPEIVRKAVDPLLKSAMAPLKSFWVKTQLAYALEIIDKDTYDAINLIRDLRNAFAHRKAPASLSDPQVSVIVGRLPHHLQMVSRAVAIFVKSEIAKVRSVAPDAHVPAGLRPERVMFMAASMFLNAQLETAARSRVRAT